MDEARANRIYRLQQDLLDRNLPEPEWLKYLEAQCPDDPDVRAEVVRLMQELEVLLEAPDTPPLLIDDIERREDPLLGVIIDGRYRIDELLRAQGGMGTVYRAMRIAGDVNKPVAVKVLSQAVNTARLKQRFQREMKILAQLEHRAIVKVFDDGLLPDGRPYYVMEWIEGGLALDRYCDTHQLGLDARLLLFQQVCDAVHYSHQQNIVHRDLKPGNILVTPDGQPKLLDFGISKSLDEESALRTLHDERLGTPEYMSPEQIDGRLTTRKPTNTRWV